MMTEIKHIEQAWSILTAPWPLMGINGQHWLMTAFVGCSETAA